MAPKADAHGAPKVPIACLIYIKGGIQREPMVPFEN
jgi:hypothetical protein